MSKKEVSLNSREKIVNFEKALINIADGVNIEGDGKKIVRDGKIAPIKHAFTDGVYIRQMDMPKGNAVIGAIHKHLHVWFLLTGHVTIATENNTEDYIAPCYVISQPGTKRVIIANEDSIFVNIHKNPSNTKDLDKLEKEIVALNYEEYEEYINKNK
jgi:quercetin dioxygenase-like cupin family protein|tara:strand:- start:1740 stop:2210 length:471 start_codon:yes stop_codon:yes gene_type:complete